MAGRRLAGTGERALVDQLRRLFDGDGRSGIGDDCAVIPWGEDVLLATTDLTTDGIHYTRDTPAELKGWYAAAVNISDIAAMGGKPLGLLMAYGMPRDTAKSEFDAISKGIQECARHHGVKVVGGDTKESSAMTIVGTAIGVAKKGRVLMRYGARKGDFIVLTGKLGRMSEWVETGGKRGIERMMRIEARVKEGQALAAAGATSCIDLSDGFALSVHYLSEASKVGMSVDLNCIPFYPGIKSEEKQLEAVYAGGDYELLATIPRKHFPKAKKAVERAGGTLSAIGAVGGSRVTYMDQCCVRPLERKGWQHFEDNR